MAWVDFHKKIIENTFSENGDQWHLDVIHMSRSSDVTDRTAFLLNQDLENPAEGMFRNLKKICRAIDDFDKKLIFWVPCNTFHAPVIFNQLLQLVKDHKLEVEVLHMIDEIGKYISSRYPSFKNIGLMSTNWTKESRIYHDVLESTWFNIVEVSNLVQQELHDSIYNNERWIKAISPVTSIAEGNFKKYCMQLKSQGAEAIILWCTEIPLALSQKELYDIPLIDATNVFAKALVKWANPNKLIQEDES